MMNNEAAQKFLAEISKNDKARLWEKGSMCRVYVGKNGRFVEFNDGVADVSGMRIHQAQQGAKAVCERVGVQVLDNI